MLDKKCGRLVIPTGVAILLHKVVMNTILGVAKSTKMHNACTKLCPLSMLLFTSTYWELLDQDSA